MDRRDQAYDAGMAVRREMFGAAGAEQRIAQATDFNRPFEELVTRYCFPAASRRSMPPPKCCNNSNKE